MEPEILYEDDYVLAINKPSGWVVNRAESVKGETVQEWVEERVPRVARVPRVSRAKNSRGTRDTFDSRDTFYQRSGIVHRLDKETSGALLIAKTPEAFQELQRQFKSREVEKVYVALVHGKVEPEEGTITAPVGRLPWNRERFGVLAGGREAETRYKVIKKIGGAYSLVEFYPKTGRTHQIRVHAKSINHPLVSDTFYAGRKTSRRDRQWCPRLFLHASKIVFTHPKTLKRVIVEAPLPQELEKAILNL